VLVSTTVKLVIGPQAILTNQRKNTILYYTVLIRPLSLSITTVVVIVIAAVTTVDRE